MNTKIIVLITAGVLTVVGLCVAELAHKPKASELTPEQIVARVGKLENRIRSLEKANAKLSLDLQQMQQPRMLPAQSQ